MKKSHLIIAIAAATVLSSCVSKKKYTELESNYNNTRSELQKTQVEKEDLENKMSEIEMRVVRFNQKIESLKTEKDGMMVSTATDQIVLSENNRRAMRKTLQNVPAEKLANAKTLKDSLNLAIAYNVSKKFTGSESTDNLNISVDETVVMINIDDDLLFGDSSYRVGEGADAILGRIAAIVKSEPSLEILVEGHTDSRKVKTGSYVKDNWDLSTERSAAIVRRLQEKFGVAPEQLIVAGRSSYDPIVANDNKSNMAKNRRTKIIIMPNLDKFFAMLESEAVITIDGTNN